MVAYFYMDTDGSRRRVLDKLFGQISYLSPSFLSHSPRVTCLDDHVMCSIAVVSIFSVGAR